jgi:hypothetical protein
VTNATDSGPLSQPSDSDFTGRAKKHPAKEFKVRPEPSSEQLAEDEGGDTRNGTGHRNYFSLTAWKDLIKFEGGGPWLKENGGLIALSAAIIFAAVCGLIWKVWK